MAEGVSRQAGRQAGRRLGRAGGQAGKAGWRARRQGCRSWLAGWEVASRRAGKQPGSEGGGKAVSEGSDTAGNLVRCLRKPLFGQLVLSGGSKFRMRNYFSEFTRTSAPNHSEPERTGMEGQDLRIWGGLNLPNHSEPERMWMVWSCRVTTGEFGMVRTCRTCPYHSERYDHIVSGLECLVWFEPAEPPRSTQILFEPLRTRGNMDGRVM